MSTWHSTIIKLDMRQTGTDDASALEGGRHRIDCIDRDLAAEAGHDHVTRVGTRDPDGAWRRWSLVEVVSAWREGETFWIEGHADADPAEVRPSVCPRCRLVTVASEPPEALRSLLTCPAGSP